MACRFFSGEQKKMSTRLLGVALAAATMLAATTALAVDVRNDDGKEHEVVVSVWKSDQSLETIDTNIKLAPGEVRTGVCESCLVLLGKAGDAPTVEVSGSQVVTIQKGGTLDVQ